MSRVQHVGEQVENLLARLRAAGDDTAATAEELVRLLVELYGDGLQQVVVMLRAGGPAGTALLERLTADPLVESLLLLHELHPLDTDSRIQRALDRVRPYLGSHAGDVRYLGVTGGVARLQLEGNCHGCPSSAVTVALAIEGAVQDAAPEVSEVVVEGMTEPPGPPLLQISPRPADATSGPAAPGDAAAGHGGWVSMPEIGPPSSRPVTAMAGSLPVLVCAVRGTLYAYRDACPACESSLGSGQLEREQLTCQCGARYDVTRAGRGLDEPDRHLDPLPLLSDSQGVRVAVPAAVGL